MNGVGDATVVVGFDPRSSSVELLRAAAEEALRRGAGLAVVTIVEPDAEARVAETGEAAASRRRLADAVAAIDDVTQGLGVATYCLAEGEVSAGHPLLASALCLVVGTRGEYGRRAFGIHSASRLLLKGTDCPVLAVPQRLPRPALGFAGATERPLVVAGVGPHAADADVVRAAFAQARARRADLSIVHTFHPGADPPAGALRHAADVVAQAIEGAAWDPDCHPSILLTDSSAATALVAQSAQADLVVVGTRPGALSGLVRDSVSRDLVAAAQCPVLVIPRHRVRVADHERAVSAAYR